MKKDTRKLGEILQEAGVIDDFQLKSALSYQGEWGGRLGAILIKKGFVTEDQVLAVVEQQLGLPSVSLGDVQRPPDEVMKLVRVDVARKFCIFPLGFEGSRTLKVATADPTDLKMIDDIQFMLGVRVKPVLALESEINRAIDIHYEGKISVERERIAMRASRSLTPPPADVTEKTVIERPVGLETKDPDARPRAEVSQKAVIESLIDLLVSKGVFTREELLQHIRSRKS